MEPLNSDLTYLFTVWYTDAATPEEREELSKLLEDNTVAEEELTSLMRSQWKNNQQTTPYFSDTESERLLQKIFEACHISQPAPVRRVFNWKKMAAAASILLLVGIGSYFLIFNNPLKEEKIVATISYDVKAPATNKAFIQLADGRTVALDSIQSGVLATQGGVKVIKNENGEITYQTTTGEQAPTIQFNTLYNPRGSKTVMLTLGDGSQVWLNAESSLKYPTAFTGSVRKVQITGEAYFEVRFDKARFFHVEVNGMDVQVLGTHFNINSYPDEESIKTTLFEGSIKVSKSDETKLVKPGQQAQVNPNGSITINDKANMEEALAWKNGYFYFVRANIQTVMRQLARWYDVEVRYKGKVTEELFVGKIQRKLNLSEVLDILQTTGIKYRLENRVLTLE